MNSPASNPPFDTSTARQASQQKPPGSRLYAKENYLSWPLINVKNVAKYFPESEETQKGHMRGQRQGVRSTRVTKPTKDTPPNIPHKKKGDILITEHEVKSLMYADQT
jgi:hypothetical protein